jgi:hypothetical protein
MKLYALAYACKLYKEEGGENKKFDEAYKNMLQNLGKERNLSSIEQIDALLKFLNRWLCRIPEDNFPSLREGLQNWARNWVSRIPPANDQDICSLKPEERAQIGSSYESLLQFGDKLRFQDTAAAKTLHALRPNILPIWDREVKAKFAKRHERQTRAQLYREFIGEVASEISELREDVERLGLSLSKVPQLLKHDGYSLVKLVDEYEYMTITRKCKIPSRAHLESWISLDSQENVSGWYFVPPHEEVRTWLSWADAMRP